MLLTRSLWIKALVTTVATGAFISLYEVTMRDTKEPALKGPPAAGDHFSISATAYCKGSVTASGVAVQAGAAAADRELFPLGSIVQVDGSGRYDGMYTILDTGPEIKGPEVDLYMWSCTDALEFGRRTVKMRVLRLGWDPRATATPPPRLLDRLLRRQSRAQPASKPEPAPLPSQPLTIPQFETAQPETAPTESQGEKPQGPAPAPDTALTTALQPPQ